MIVRRSLALFLVLAAAAIPARVLAQPFSCDEIFESTHFAATENYRIEILNGFRATADGLKKYRETLEEDFEASVQYQNGLPQGKAITAGGLKIGSVPLTQNPSLHPRTWQAFLKAFRRQANPSHVTMAIQLAKQDPYFAWLKKENPGRDPVGYLQTMLLKESDETRLTPRLAVIHLAQLFDPNISPEQIELAREIIDMYKSELTFRHYGARIFGSRDTLSNETWNLAPSYRQVLRALQITLVHTSAPHARKFPGYSYISAFYLIAEGHPALSVLKEIGKIRSERPVTTAEYQAFAPRLQAIHQALKLPEEFDLTLLYDAFEAFHHNAYRVGFGYEPFLLELFEKDNPRLETIAKLRLIIELAGAPASQKGVENFLLKYKEFLKFGY